LLGGLPNDDKMTTRFALEIPRGLSLLSAHDPQARVSGLEEFPRRDWPDVRLVHWSFDLMVGCGLVLLAVSLATTWLWWRHRHVPDSAWFLRSVVVCGPLGFLAIQAGWMVTELGRQPWIVYGVMRTQEAVTPMPGIAVPFFSRLLSACAVVSLAPSAFLSPQIIEGFQLRALRTSGGSWWCRSFSGPDGARFGAVLDLTARELARERQPRQ
jgi:cytochrome bd-type quinol oxidase subunit 1